ncbi:rod-binding protein [Roseovarius sp. CAU 1744]|uniref:rod-binding protein n=1 Tax=Roseovarius sp. CAU 1744 TaxID=3140368 RepID=UPI00325B7107
MTEFLPVQPRQQNQAAITRELSARQAAEKLEATFLAEMLKSAGFGEQDNSFSGSAGEDQFASFQRMAMAEQMVKKGGIGLAEAFYESMVEKRDDN